MTELLRSNPVVSALVLGLLAITAVLAIQPDLVVHVNLVAILGAFLIASFMFPGGALIAGVIFLILSPENFLVVNEFVDKNFPSLGVQSVQKFFVMFTMLPALIRCGLRRELNPALIALGIMFAVSAVLSSKFPTLTSFQMIKTLIGLSMPFMYFSLRFRKDWAEPFLFVVATAPILSLILGYFAEWAHLRDIARDLWVTMGRDVTGAFRLKGINISAGLAFNCYIALFVSFYQAVLRKKRGYFIALAAALIELVLTGTRTPMAAGILMLAMGTFFATRSQIQSRAKILVLLGGAILVSAILAVYWPQLEKRNSAESIYNEQGINTSGRAEIWSLLWDIYTVNPVFGRGMGAGAIALLDDLDKTGGTAASHNEYMRLLVDGGAFGLIVYLVGLIWLMRQECRGISRGTARYIGVMFFTFALYSFTDNTISGPPTMMLFFALWAIIRQAQIEAAEAGGRLVTNL